MVLLKGGGGGGGGGGCGWHLDPRPSEWAHAQRHGISARSRHLLPESHWAFAWWTCMLPPLGCCWTSICDTAGPLAGKPFFLLHLGCPLETPVDCVTCPAWCMLACKCIEAVVRACLFVPVRKLPLPQLV